MTAYPKENLLIASPNALKDYPYNLYLLPCGEDDYPMNYSRFYLCLAMAARAGLSGYAASDIEEFQDASVGTEASYYFDVPQDLAVSSLDKFSEIVGKPLVYLMDQVEGVRLNRLSGYYNPETALERLVEDTELKFIEDEKTGVWVIKLRDEFSVNEDVIGSANKPESTSENMEIENNNRPQRFFTRIMQALSTAILAGTAVTANAQDDLEDEENIYKLSPFIVTSEEDEGYRASATLAGTRIKTDLKDLASSISVVTSQFLEDTGAVSNTDLLVYTTNTEVGGIFGNFAGVGNTQGIGEGANLSAPNNNTRVRGLDAADNTRNYFLTDIPWDSYIVDRVEIQRGPNSILFGVGSPAGIINTSTVVPSFSNEGEYENRLGSYGSYRHSFNYNREIIDDVLAIKVAYLNEEQQYKQDPAFENDERQFVAVTFNPDWFGEGNNTTITANFEKGDIEANRPRILPPIDQVTPWWTGLNQATYNAAWSWANNAQIDRGNGGRASNTPENNVPWLGNEMNGITGGGVGFFYNNGESTPSIIRQTDTQTNFGIGPDGAIDRGIDAFVFGRLQDVAGFNEYSRNAEADAIARGLANPFPGASKNFYKDIHLNDPGVFDFYNNLIDGDNKREYDEWEAYNLGISQTFLNNRFGVEFIYDYQDYERSNYDVLGFRPAIGIDINTHTGLIPVTYPNAIDGETPDPTTVTGGDPNPNVGRAYVSGGRPRSSSTAIERENLRLTAFAEFRGSDIFDEDSILARLIGRNIFTGLISRDERNIEERQWMNFATGANYATIQDRGALVDGWERGVSYAVYLSDDLSGVSSPWNLNLPGIQSTINPAGQYDVRYFNSMWNAPGVDPSAFYRHPVDGSDATQSENWQNYVGIQQLPVNILNANAGDRNDLYTSAFKRTEVLDSVGLTWQGYWWDGMIVPTFGWREDEIETWGRSGDIDPDTGVRDINFDNPKEDTIVKKGETISWGVVAHTDSWLMERLAYGTHFSFFYNRSKNFRADNRVGFGGDTLPSPEGRSEDYGIVLNTFDDKLSLRVTWYTTEVENANIGSSSPLGNNVWFLANIEAWGTASALTHDLFWQGELPGLDWFSNYGMIDENRWGEAGWATAPFSQESINHPSNQALFAAVTDWYATMPEQSFFDAYGLPIDRAKAQGSLDDRRTMVDNGNWNPYNGIGSIQPSGGGRVNGLSPTMTINQESKGVEFEATYRPLSNWNITVNASKTEAVRTDLGAAITEWIDFQYNRFQGPAGDIRMWWGGDQTIREYYDQFVYQAYLFQLDANGQSAPEIRPWRYNIITNYNFEEGKFSGVNVGGAFRWQDDAILGYRLDPTETKLDVTNPIEGGAEANLDLWFGYQREIVDGKIDWRIQLNLRNVGEDYRLIPVSVNPDGSMAAGRIAEGTTWELTNTFSF